MKRLTISRMASARLKAERKSYLSLAIGVFLSLFLVSSMCLIVQGLYLQQHRETVAKVGYIQCMHLDGGDEDEQVFIDSGLFDRLGHVYISGSVSSSNFYLGWYDQAGQDIANRHALEGRMPTQAGEIAMEKSACDAFFPDASIGDTVELTIAPFNGTEEKRTFTLVGILAEQSMYLKERGYTGGSIFDEFPSLFVSTEEPLFATGNVKTHRILTMAKGHDMREALIWEYENRLKSGSFKGISNGGLVISYGGYPSELLNMDNDLMGMYIMVGLLFFALCCACCTGIAGAMEGQLLRRREEIGILRAVGATRRQIRRIFGRESLLLALILTPFSVACACGVAWGMEALSPNQFVFRANPVLLVPILVLGMLVVAMASYLPLRRASKTMPMSVLRDTEMLRRNRRIRSRSSFSVPRLIALRQFRTRPTRQVGASLMVMLMLICTMVGGNLMGYASTGIDEESPAFSISNPSGFARVQEYFYIYDSRALSQQDLAQIEQLSHVRRVEANRSLKVTLVMDEKNTYLNDWNRNDLWGEPRTLSLEEYKERARLFYPNITEEQLESMGQNYLEGVEESKRVMEALGLDNKAPYEIEIATAKLDEDELKELESYLIDGKINLEAINAGREVIICTPDKWYWETRSLDGSITGNYAKDRPKGARNAELVAHNDGNIVAGQNLRLLQMYSNEQDSLKRNTTAEFNLSDYERVDDEVTVGAVVSATGNVPGLMNGVCIVTTEEGFRQMPFFSNSVNVDIYLDGAVDEEEEQKLQNRITSIARRQNGSEVYNSLKRARETEAQRKQTLLLFAGITIIFFAVAVSMIVSSVSRNIQADGRLIGMLRAVGADERTIRACYQGQVAFSVAIGTVLFGIFFALCTAYSRKYMALLSHFNTKGIIVLLLVCLGFALLCLLLCLLMLRARVRQTSRRSIVETIKEM